VNAVEIEEAISNLVSQPFDSQNFAYAFLEAFGNKATTIKRLRSGVSNKSDLGGVLQTNNIHMAAAPSGLVKNVFEALRSSPATSKAKARFIAATDGDEIHAEDLSNGEPLACRFDKLPDHFGFFLPLAGISTVREIAENAFDIRATGRLNRLYVELLKDNPAWGTADRRHDMNHFMARLIFCFFAEDTNIFLQTALFTATVERMSERDSSNTHEVISTLFRAMNTDTPDRARAGIPRWADPFPYVNGGLFSGSTDVPKFSKLARAYLLHIGNLDWTKINPDIFGSMIQAVAEDEERDALGMHYTSVPNILRVLNPLFLDDLRSKLAEAGDNPRKLLNLRSRMSRIRVFDPACGSGNFLVIAYKEMRGLEYEINKRRGEAHRRTDIALTNFRGIELRDFPAEIARLALIIAEFQCDVIYRGQKEAIAEFLPLDSQNWITCGNALRMDWLSICPTTGTDVKFITDDLFSPILEQSQIDFENSGGENYVCGNPPYAGLSSQSAEQKEDLRLLFEGRNKYWKSFDYVMGWVWKAHQYMRGQTCRVAFVATNSICQGQLVPMFWPMILGNGTRINFAHTSFKWRNLAAKNAGVTVVVIGMSNDQGRSARLFGSASGDEVVEKVVANINAYIVAAPNIYVEPVSKAPADRPVMFWGNKPTDGGHLILTQDEARQIAGKEPRASEFLRPYFGSQEFINGLPRVCIWVNDEKTSSAEEIESFADRFKRVREFRSNSSAKETRPAAAFPHRFRQIQGRPGESSLIVPIHSSESREFLPVGLLPPGSIVSNAAYALYNAPLWNLALIASRLHLVWIATVCGKLKTDFRYSNTLGWNTFPFPPLTEKTKGDLTHCAEEILLSREAHFPATVADLYQPESMPADLREAHDRNDEVIERSYIGRRFKNDTERLERLFDLYIKSNSVSKSVKPVTPSTEAGS
jgi:hypothetical protein